ncbi:Pef1p NDAI_0D04150 [Naumovozyma dairenensis CBS 421]|uniref:EF-hand domain-containing protein n=1 Tax=Naumovozyma dairenensis (strain ATCC 10597 / BCRC 20456 / CBS 421 / NBRC 0211 / NRRL Y-12639) TaxID=1071378 RepID=G0WAB8_NAUDC|nr:hypothetical protein NDAI_0D04150 [Naumovozyma dairenensis CBS 421]CCD24729.1 hypothetical protein NDAI_0D04150 [Naumovozyma dairenensis CBS 421]
MGKKKLNYAAGDDLLLFATPKEAMEESRRRILEDKIRRRQRDERITSAPVVNSPHEQTQQLQQTNSPQLIQRQPLQYRNTQPLPVHQHHPPLPNHLPLGQPNVRSNRPIPPPSNMSQVPILAPTTNEYGGRPIHHALPYVRHSSSSPTSRKSPTPDAPHRVANDPNKDVQIAVQLFNNHDIRKRGRLTAEELQNLLQNDDNSRFCISSIDSLINLFGATRFGTVNQQEFVSLYKRVKIWRKVYVDNDINGSCTISSAEFYNSLQQLEYLIPFEVCEKFFDQFAEFINENNFSKELKFDKFVEALVWLLRLTKVFRNFDSDQNGIAQVHYKDFIEMTLYLGRFLPH